MWQFVVAAAVAGTGFFARRLFSNGDHYKSERSEKFKLKEEENAFEIEREKQEEKEPFYPVKPEVSISSIVHSSLIPSESDEICDSWSSEKQEKSIFRFSSLDRCQRSESRLGNNGLRKKLGLRGNVDGFRRRVGVGVRVEKIGQESDFMNGDEVVVTQRKKGRRFLVCLKRRRTSKNGFGKCESCSSKGSSFLSRGLGVGIMYMISAGKAEIDKLNAAVDETTKVVHDLKSELHKRKLSRDLKDSSCKNGVDICSKETVGKDKHPLIAESDIEYANPDDCRILGLPLTDDGECASSVLTEEPELEVLEIDRLEAELESELQKISCGTSEEPYGLKGRISDLGEVNPEHLVDVTNTELSANGPPGLHELLGIDSISIQSHGVSPFELDWKLCHLLIEQQESQIGELESKLDSAQTKLHEKEAELQALKECVRHFREFSLETASDNETEEAEGLNVEQQMNSYANSSLVDGYSKSLLTGQKLVVGMKRSMEFESFDCHIMQ